MNLLEGLWQATNGPKMAPHVGEVFAIWTYYTALVNAHSLCLVLANHTADADVRKMIDHMVGDLEEPQIKVVTQVMKTEGIPFPPTAPSHSLADETAIPTGAKLSEFEITNLLVVKLEGLLLICHNAMAQSLRDDLGMMFHRFHGQVVAQGLTIKKTMLKRGWLMVPPPYEGHTPVHRPTE